MIQMFQYQSNFIINNKNNNKKTPNNNNQQPTTRIDEKKNQKASVTCLVSCFARCTVWSNALFTSQIAARTTTAQSTSAVITNNWL
jgi:cytoskeletal protein RodZ